MTISQGTINKLQHVLVSAPNLDLRRFPDFFIAGPHNTGSTWLYKNLRIHPQVFMTIPKEIHYFIYLKERNNPNYVSNKLNWYLDYFTDTASSYFLKTMYALYNNKEFYRPKIRGEASATYATLDSDVIGEIVTLNPNIRIILTIRNPIERAWSHAKRELMRDTGRTYEEISDKELEEFLLDDYIISCSKITEVIDSWTDRLHEDNLLLIHFDDIRNSPRQLLIDVFNFLGVKAHKKYISRLSQKKINKSSSMQIPNRYEELLKDIFKDELVRLNDRYDLVWN